MKLFIARSRQMMLFLGGLFLCIALADAESTPGLPFEGTKATPAPLLETGEVPSTLGIDPEKMMTLPVRGSSEFPVTLLELGSAPAFRTAEEYPALRVEQGTVFPGNGTESVLVEKDEVQVFHQGFGSWDARFRFDLKSQPMPGKYRFFARYKSGGEVSQVTQTFKVKAGASPELLGLRAEIALTNPTPWEYQWLEAESTVTLFPGDRWIEIENSGKADGAKVFDAFLLKADSSFDDWMSPEQAQLRSRLLAITRERPNAKRKIIILDGKRGNDDVFFQGLLSEASKSRYEKLSGSYLIGSEAETLADTLGLSELPAALITDDHYTVIGILTRPADERALTDFLDRPNRAAMPLTPSPENGDPATDFKAGMPTKWLVGGVQDGLSGWSIFGLDAENFLRPNPGQTYLSLEISGGTLRTWHAAATQPNGSVDIEPSTDHSMLWSRGSAYAVIYLHVDQSLDTRLHLQHSGIKSEGWLDGQAFAFYEDPSPPANPVVAALSLTPGWHCLLIKLITQQDKGQRFYFKAQFTDPQGRTLNAMKSQLSDPTADLDLNKIAARLRPLLFVESAANLPHPGDRIDVRIDTRWHAVLEESRPAFPLPRFEAKLRLRLVDYSGNEIESRKITGLFPAESRVHFESRLDSGYYAIYPTLYTVAGKLIMHYPPDGFSVIGGSAAQKTRIQDKKLWNNYYYALADGDKSFNEQGDFFTWLQRMGIYRNYGSYPGFSSDDKAKWEHAKKLGLSLFADSSGDSSWLNDNPEDARKFFAQAAEFTRYFKASNEIDIRHEAEWAALRKPEHWVQRIKREYDLAHQLRRDAHYVGGSLVRPGGVDPEGSWFEAVLNRGLDQYQDAWDVHAYPQYAPVLGGFIGNAETEDERGVLAVYKRLGRKNRLPFWLGETGAKAMHGLNGRRWQAEVVAKMIAWANSRSDYLGLAFCIAHEYDLGYGRLWDYSMGHKPGEAALYTAGALIDGFAFHAVETPDPKIQAAYFGNTFMIWRTDEATGTWRLKLDPNKSWLVVNVVGKTRELPLDSKNEAEISISPSPLYVIERAEYERLTRH